MSAHVDVLYPLTPLSITLDAQSVWNSPSVAAMMGLGGLIRL
ncbi:MAG: hypothetical protein QM756_05210 [Polyangiaceae bacterium]